MYVCRLSAHGELLVFTAISLLRCRLHDGRRPEHPARVDSSGSTQIKASQVKAEPGSPTVLHAAYNLAHVQTLSYNLSQITLSLNELARHPAFARGDWETLLKPVQWGNSKGNQSRMPRCHHLLYKLAANKVA